MSETVERKFALVKISEGDYLLPANDGVTLWRIVKGEYAIAEDGISTEPGWEFWRWIHRLDSEHSVDTLDLDWAEFEHYGAERTRKQAIDAALKS